MTSTFRKLTSTEVMIENEVNPAVYYVSAYLNDPSNRKKYNQMVKALDKSLNKLGKVDGKRAILVLPDGIVSYDSEAGDKNKFENVGKAYVENNQVKYPIAENHNTRTYCTDAILSFEGFSEQIKYSSTTNTLTQYYSSRQGISMEEPLGVLVLAVQV